jgi:predicted aspartyl protease
LALAVSGPLIDISIQGVGSAFAGIAARGLIDTGASIVCISQRIADQLNLVSVDEDDMGVVGGGTIRANIYMGYLSVESLGFRELMRLYAVPMKQPGHSVLLGRSFLKHFIVTFNGPEGMFHFSTPPAAHDHGFDDFAT